MNIDETDAAADLITAVDRLPEAAERRQSLRRRTSKDRRRGITKSVGLEISPSGVAMAVIETNEASGAKNLIVDRIDFSPDSGPARGDWKDGTLLYALIDLTVKHQLSGQAVRVGIGGDPCMTRVVAGPNEEVDGEVLELKERTDRYIGMGRGDKVCCETSMRIDAKRKRVWVTVAMRNAVDEIAAAIQTAGMRLIHMEHTMLVLCRLLQAYQCDTSEPVLLVVDDMGRLDLGISYRGQLLLDYRPAMPDNSVSDGAIVQRHITCLRRYVASQVQRDTREMNRIFVLGTSSRFSSLNRNLDDQISLNRCDFPIAELCEGLETEDEISFDSGVITSIGMARHAAEDGMSKPEHNLMSTLNTQTRVPWMALIRTTWPIAASIAAAIVLTLASVQSSSRLGLLESKIEALSSASVEVARMRLVLEKHLQRDQQVQRLKNGLTKPVWSRVLWQTGSILPKGVWLDSLSFDNGGSVQLVGASYSDQAVYSYIDQLKQSGIFSRVVLVATSAIRVSNGPAYRFEISAEVDHASPKAVDAVAVAEGRKRPHG